MALPSVTKTWQYNVNNVITCQVDAATMFQKLVYAFKTALLGFGTAPWTVVKSSDSTGFGATDRWTDYTKLVWCQNASGQAHSWIVLQNSVTSVQLLIDLNGNGANPWVQCWALAVSQNPAGATGFVTGGSTTARPTASDEIVILGQAGNQGFTFYTTTPYEIVWNVMQSTDGQSVRWFINSLNISRCFGGIDAITEAVSGFANPVLWNHSFAGAPNHDYMLGQLVYYFKKTGVTYTGYGTCENTWRSTVTENTGYSLIPNEIDGTWPMLPIGFVSPTTLVRGRHGRFNDMWAGSTSIPNGFCYPNDGTRQFIQVGNVILPWNGTNPRIA